MPRLITPAKFQKQFATAMLITFFCCRISLAQSSFQWKAATGDWSDASNWFAFPPVSNDLPGLQDNVNINDDGTALISSGVIFTNGESLGNDGIGTIDQTGGINTTNGLELGNDSGSGNYNLSGTGTLSVSGYEDIAVLDSTSTFAQSAGLNSATVIQLGELENSTGIYNLNGGEAHANEFYVGGDVGAAEPTAQGILYVSGNSTLSVTDRLAVSANSQITIAGGSVSANAFVDSTAYIQTGGNASFKVFAAGPVNLSGGSVTLSPEPILAVAAPADYAGDITISGLSALNCGQTLDANSLTMTGGTLGFSTSGGNIVVQNAANLSDSAITFFPTGAPPSANFPILTASSLSSTISFTPYQFGRMVFTPSVSGNSIIVNVTGAPGSLEWNNSAGGDGQTWDEQNSQNWTSSTTIGNPNQFYLLDNVTFDDNNNGNFDVNVGFSVQPNSMTVNTSSAYTFTGFHLNGGTGGLHVTAGTLILKNLNSWYDATVNGGSLSIVNGSGGLSVTGTEIIADTTTGIFNLSDGSNAIAGSLTVGANSGSNGIYNLSGGVLMATVSAGSQGSVEYIGYSGSGNFVQTGGINIAGGIALGVNPGSFGSYSVSGSSQVSAYIIVGSQGQGIFNQSGGAVSGQTLGLAQSISFGQPAGIGNYSLSGDGSMSFNYELIGRGGIATFYQSAGTNNVQSLFVGIGSLLGLTPFPGGGSLPSTPSSPVIPFTAVSVYYLSGGTLNTNEEDISGSGTTEFIQTGGSNTVTSFFRIGENPGTSGIYSLSGNGSLTITNTAYIGGFFNSPGGTGILSVAGRATLNIMGMLQIYPTSEVNINGGNIRIGPLVISPGGILNVNSALTIQYGMEIGLIGSLDDPVATIRGYLQTGYDNGKWDGTGINSSLAASMLGTAIGYIDTGTQIILQYTWIGDANLDGIVNSADLSAMSSAGITWASGDFNYDGVVNADDYALFMLGSQYGSGNISNTLPEPAILVMPITLLFLRRRAHIA